MLIRASVAQQIWRSAARCLRVPGPRHMLIPSARRGSAEPANGTASAATPSWAEKGNNGEHLDDDGNAFGRFRARPSLVRLSSPHGIVLREHPRTTEPHVNGVSAARH